jgi:ATP-dependent exoDNAse (exonuclease V) beta subunit
MTAISSEACSVVIANAGSGKTWTLANRIVRWCIDELRAGRPPEPARILAVTFTRKAAGEILARILAHAAQGASSGASGEKARADFASVVGNATADEYLSVLEALCGELHRLQVGTIDGFFHRVASALPDAVGLPPEWTVGDERDIEEIRAEVAATILADPAAEELLDLLEDGEPKPSVTTAITKLLGGSGQSPLDMYRATSAKGQVGIDRAWRWVERLLAAEKFGENALGAEQRADLAARFAALELPKTKKGAPNASWTKQHAALLAILTEGELRDLADLPYFAALFDGHSYSKQPVPVEFHELAVLLAAHLRAELLRDLASRLKGALRVLPQASAALAVAQAEKGLYSFSDIGRGVARAAQRPGSPVADANALRTALGCDIRDLAIDEAQDTSVEQFLAMRPLLEEVLGATRSGRFLLVGDPKQSIYGWRGGTPGLIAHIEESYASRLSPGVALTRSFRSSPLVMDFVNRVFGKLSDDLPPLVESAQLVDLVKVAPWLKSEDLALESTESAFKRAVARWPFAHHESAKSTLAGRIDAYACAKTTTTDDGTAESETAEVDTSEVATVGGAEACAQDGAPSGELDACACAAEIAARVHREFPEHSLGILVRTNEEGNEIIAQLKSRSVAASDEGRATLLDSPAVAGIVAMLRLIDDPSDRVSHFMVSRGPMALATKLAPIESHNTSAEAGAAARAFAVRMRARLADEGLTAVLRGVSVVLTNAGLSARDAGRVARVVAIAEDLADVPMARTLDFIDAIEADKADASSSDKVRVMTVHKSKGLEFDEVILVSLDKGWGATPTGWAMLATSATEPPQLVSPLANEQVRKWIPELCVLERDERRRRLLDDLSSLYVALTRARIGLHLVIAQKQAGKLPSAAKLIMRAVDGAANAKDTLGAMEPMATALTRAKLDGSRPFWSARLGVLAAQKPQLLAPPDPSALNPSAPNPSALNPRAPNPRPLITIVARGGGHAPSPSTHAPASSWAIDPFAADGDGRDSSGAIIALRGVLMHECFREVLSLDAIDSAQKREAILGPAALRASIEKGQLISTKLIDEARAVLERCATGPIAQALRPTAGVRVRTELPFVRETAEGLVHGRIDRLELTERDGVVVAATIVDFKTGAVGADQRAMREKIAPYAQQLSAYADAVAEMYGIDRAKIDLRLLFVDRGEVVEV